MLIRNELAHQAVPPRADQGGKRAPPPSVPMMKRAVGRIVLAAVLVAGMPSPVGAATLSEVIADAFARDPMLGEASANRRAIEYELEQARGLYRPQVDLEGFMGPGYVYQDFLSPNGNLNNARNGLGLGRSVGITIQQSLFNKSNDAELARQRARVESAGDRVAQRAVALAVDITQVCLDLARQQELVRLAEDNVRAHAEYVEKVKLRVEVGYAGAAELHLSNERMALARTSLEDAERRLGEARNTYKRLLGQFPSGACQAPGVRGLPTSLERALVLAIETSPALQAALADLDVAKAEHAAAKVGGDPRVDLEVRAVNQEDTNGLSGSYRNISALVRFRLNLYRGGINGNATREHAERMTEAEFRITRMLDDAEFEARQSWLAMESAQRLIPTLEERRTASFAVVSDYLSQFEAGRRGLLDLLDAQNWSYIAQSQLITARYAAEFSRYRVMGATGQLLAMLGVPLPTTAVKTPRPVPTAAFGPVATPAPTPTTTR